MTLTDKLKIFDDKIKANQAHLLKSTGTVSNFSKSILSTSAFKLFKSDFAPNLEVSTPVALFKFYFVA